MIRVLYFCFFGLVFFIGACKHYQPHLSIAPREQVFTSENMADFMNAIDFYRIAAPNKLIILDIDDTILTATGNLGTPPWFYSMVDVLRQNGIERSLAFSIMNPIDNAVQSYIKTLLIEDYMNHTIAQWHKDGSIVVVLTSRPYNLQKVTKKQLEEAGIQFNQSIFQCVSSRWDNKKGIFVDGVLYVGSDLKKRDVFEQFLGHLEACGQHIMAFSADL